MVDWREELEDEKVRVQLQRDGLLLHPVKREEISRIYHEFVSDYGELNYERFLKASIAETPPVPVDRRPRRRYRPFGGQNPPPRVADCMDASSIYRRYAEQQCGGYNFATYVSEWMKQNSAETAKNRQLFLLRRSSPGVELNDRPIPSVPTLGDYVDAPTTVEEEEQSTTPPPPIAGSSVYEGYPDGVDSFGHYILDWVENKAAELEHNRQLLLQRRSSPGVEPCPSVDWWPQHQDDEQLTTEVEEELSNIYRLFVADHAGGLNYVWEIHERLDRREFRTTVSNLS